MPHEAIVLKISGNYDRVIAVPCMIPDPAGRARNTFLSRTWTTREEQTQLGRFLNVSLQMSRPSMSLRVWLFDYEGVRADGPSLKHPAQALLQSATALHGKEPHHPIIFVAHSLGGFVVKQVSVLQNICIPRYLLGQLHIFMCTSHAFFC
jgi:hypothetical protein